MTFDEFVTARGLSLLRYAVMLTGDRDLALDVVQETLLRAQVRWRRISQADRPELYVRRMLTNEYLGWRRGPWYRRVVLRGDAEHSAPDLSAPTRDHADATADRDEMWTLLAGLPRQQRAALVLRYYEGLTDQQIADVLGCKVGTVRAHVSRALAALRGSAELTTRMRVPGSER